MDCHFIKEKLEVGLICMPYVPIEKRLANVLTSIPYVPIEEQLANVLIKGLYKGMFNCLINKLGMIDIFKLT